MSRLEILACVVIAAVPVGMWAITHEPSQLTEASAPVSAPEPKLKKDSRYARDHWAYELDMAGDLDETDHLEVLLLDLSVCARAGVKDCDSVKPPKFTEAMRLLQATIGEPFGEPMPEYLLIEHLQLCVEYGKSPYEVCPDKGHPAYNGVAPYKPTVDPF